MNKICPNKSCASPENIIRDGFFRRKDDSKIIQRFRCKSCGSRFSNATFSDAYRQKSFWVCIGKLSNENFHFWPIAAGS